MMIPRRKIAFLVSALIFAWLFPSLPQVCSFLPNIEEAEAATYSTPAYLVDPGWQNNRKRVVFYNGSHYFLLYTLGTNTIYYQSSTDNDTWSVATPLISESSSIPFFDIYLVSDAKFDLVYYISASQTRRVRTCTIAGSTITAGDPSASPSGTISKIAVARSGVGEGRIYLVYTNGGSIVVSAANNTGDAANVTGWTSWEDTKADPVSIAIVPYQNNDQALVVYVHNDGNLSKVGVFSKVVYPDHADSAVELGDFSGSEPDISSPVSISDLDNDFRFIIRPPSGGMQEWSWNNSSWTLIDANIDPDGETDHSSPSLFYDRISGDMYVFSIDTGETPDRIQRHKKPSGGIWEAEVAADRDPESDTVTYPITQMHEPPYGSSRTFPRDIVWGYRVDSLTEYNLTVGTLSPTLLYRSVGRGTLNNGEDLNTDLHTVQISGTTATFSGPMSDKIGVGDVLAYNSGGAQLAFIHGRVSSRVYTVKDKNGDTPAQAPAGTTVGVYRAYISLNNWNYQSENSNIPEPVENDVNPNKNLVSTNTVMMVACYDDGGSADYGADINGWTTDPYRYIKIYTPVSPSEVGVSQRHNGKWDNSKYRILDNSAGINITGGTTKDIWIDGLQVYLNDVTGNGNSGILINQTGKVNHRISNNIVRGADTYSGTYVYVGIYAYAATLDSKAWIWNNIVYGFNGTNAFGIYKWDGDFTVYAYNNTVYNCRTGFNSTEAKFTAKNNISMCDVVDSAFTDFSGSYSTDSTHNYSSDTTAPDNGGANPSYENKTLAEVDFFSTTSGSENFHLQATSDAIDIDVDTDLSSDPNFAFSHDIDGHYRYGSWDIGADEYDEGMFEYRRLITVDRTKITNPALLPIAFDAVSSAETLPAAGAISLTWSHTVGSGQDPILIVGVSIRNDSNQAVDSVTYNGTGLTRIGFVTNPAVYPPGYVRAELWYLPAASFPAPGTYDVEVNMSATARFVAGAFSLFNVDPTTPLGTFASNSGTGNPTWAADVDVPSATGEIVVATLAKRYDDPVEPEQMAHQADRWNRTTNDVSANNVLGVGTLRGAAGSTTTPWWVMGGTTNNQQWAVAGVSLKPTTEAAPEIINLENYPLLISLSDDTLKSPANCPGGVPSPTCGHVYNSNGYDIIFRAYDDTTCGGTAPCGLDHEIEKYDGVNGQVVAWVRLPSVNGAGAASDTEIYMYYGNSSIVSSTQNKTAVWDANYMDIFHLAEPSGDATDSTSNSYVAFVQPDTGQPTHQDAKINGGYHFASDSWLLTNDGQFTVANAPLTIESWFHIDSGSPTWIGIATKNRDVSCSDDPPYCDWAGIWIGGSGELTYAWDWHNQGNIEGGAALSPGTWYYAVIAFDGGIRTGYRNGLRDTIVTSPNPSPGTYTDLTMPTRINKDLDAGGMMTGTIDEVRISTAVRSPGWILTSYNNMNNPGDIDSPGFYTVGGEEGPDVATAVDLVSFTAKGEGSSVLVEWETAQEVNHLGFELYRARSRSGPFVKLTDKVIPGLGSSVQGQSYRFEDTDVSRGELYYYRLEAIDVSGKKAPYGPICVDWDGDGMPDDWEIAHGLNPSFDDCLYDYDGDGLTNCREYELGTDPLNPDSDGDGILDGEEDWSQDRSEPAAHSLSPGVTVISKDESGITLELRTDGFEAASMESQGEYFERLRIWQYIHGLTDEVGKPELPVKGVLLDLPQGKSASLEVLETEDETLGGYRIYPVPEKLADEGGGTSRVGEVFQIDEAAYSEEGFYPGEVALLGETYTVRDQKKVQVLFHPLSFNPALGELLHRKRIRVRIHYEDSQLSALMTQGVVVGPTTLAWAPPTDGSAYKILVSQEGIYRLTRSDLAAATGVAEGSLDLYQIRLYNLGEEVAIRVSDDGEYIDFYGRAPDTAYAKYARDNVYWLILSGDTGEPKRMAAIDATPGIAPPATTHTATVVHEQNGRYWLGAPGGDSIERWFYSTRVLASGYGSGGGPQTYSFTLSGVYPPGQGSLTVSMAAKADLDHQVEISVNGIPKGTYSWSGIAWYEATIDGVDLSEGTNTVTIDCGDGLDVLYIDRFTVTYPRSFASSGNLLEFSHASGDPYEVTGFTDDDIFVYDITSPGEVQVMENVQISETGSPYTATFEPPSGAETTYLVVSGDGVKSPVAITKDRPSTLSASQNGADYIVITHRELGWDGDVAKPWLTELLQLREAQGLRVMAVDMEDIYDEFSYGLSSPQAVKDFLTHAYQNWARPALRYVLLVGDGSFDPKDHYGTGETSFVPPYLTVTEHMGETISEDWLVRLSGDDAMADLFIGRLPADSPEQAALMVNKIHDYETSPNTKDWEKTLLLISDNQTQDYESAFEEMNETVASLVPSGFSSPLRGYLGDYCPVVETCSAAPLTQDLTDWITTGALVVHYSGHGSTQIWAHEHIFDKDDVSALANGDRLPFFVSMSCLTGYFANPEAEFLNLPTSLAEVLLLASGKGAVAAFMPSGMTATDGQEIMDRALFEAIFTQDIRTLGEAIAHAKETLLAQGSQYEDVSETFLLFGDPAMALKVPLPHRPQGLSTQGHLAGVLLSWNAATDCDGGPVSGYNLYRSTTPGGNYTKVNTSLITASQYDDTSVANGTTYHYVVTSVDAQDYESVHSQEASGSTQSTNPPASESGGGGGGGCFINTVAGK